jgi:hypothetical protein
MMNAACAVLLFDPDEHDALRQSCASWASEPATLAAHEGLRQEWDGWRPYARGDHVQAFIGRHGRARHWRRLLSWRHYAVKCDQTGA